MRLFFAVREYELPVKLRPTPIGRRQAESTTERESEHDLRQTTHVAITIDVGVVDAPVVIAFAIVPRPQVSRG